MTISELKILAAAIMDTLEDQFCEKLAMQIVLEGCPDRHTRMNWRRDVEQLASDPENRKKAHALFEPIYAEIDSAVDEKVLNDLLLRLPTTGKPH